MTEGMDLLIGLDVLDEYGASICLRRGQGTLTMDHPPSTTTRASPLAKDSSPPRLVIALARNDRDTTTTNNNNNNKDSQRKVAQHVPKSSSPLPSSSVLPLPQHLGAAADIVPHDASSRAEAIGTSSCSRVTPIRRKGRGRGEDQDLLADLELLEQEAYFSSQFSSSGSDWDESDATTAARTSLATAKAGAGTEEEEEESDDDDSDDNDYADDFDMSGM